MMSWRCVPASRWKAADKAPLVTQLIDGWMGFLIVYKPVHILYLTQHICFSTSFIVNVLSGPDAGASRLHPLRCSNLTSSAKHRSLQHWEAINHARSPVRQICGWNTGARLACGADNPDTGRAHGLPSHTWSIRLCESSCLYKAADSHAHSCLLSILLHWGAQVWFGTKNRT